DSEDYASFYGRQFERYYNRQFGENDVKFITERLKYTKEQLGNDWENDIVSIHGGASAKAKDVDGPRLKYVEKGLFKKELKKELDFVYNIGIQLYSDKGVREISNYKHRENSIKIIWSHSLGADSTLEAYAIGYREKVNKIGYNSGYPLTYKKETGKIIRPERADELNIVMPRIDFIEKYLSRASKNAVTVNLYVLKNDKGLSVVKDYGDRSYETLQKKIKERKITIPDNVKIITLNPIYKKDNLLLPDYTINNHAPALDYGNPMFSQIWKEYEKVSKYGK
ncbi:hypothetical protein, partial [Leptotrichia sp. OH3620_COT-345]|uniref:hypothetical protein n=1 Tax=Leptotrichia sp. OH3620_COT-345 TaxID=2491048 RepID=UPI0013150C72